MALHTKIKHIDTLPNGVLRFRRKFPQDVAEALDNPALQVHIKNREGGAFHRSIKRSCRNMNGLCVKSVRDWVVSICGHRLSGGMRHY